MSGTLPPTTPPTTPAVPALPFRQATAKANEHASAAGVCEDRAIGSDAITQIYIYYAGTSAAINVTTPEMRNCVKTCLHGLRDIHKSKALEFLTMAAETDKV